jgi:hypothetical protein
VRREHEIGHRRGRIVRFQPGTFKDGSEPLKLADLRTVD